MSAAESHRADLVEAMRRSHTGEDCVLSRSLLESSTAEEKLSAALAVVDELPAAEVHRLATEFFIDLMDTPEALADYLRGAEPRERLWFVENIDALAEAHEERERATTAALVKQLAELEASGYRNVEEMRAAEVAR